LCYLAGELGPPERLALRQIVEGADLLRTPRGVWLLARVTDATIEALANFEADGADLEPDLCDEPETDNDLSDYELEPELDPRYCDRPSTSNHWGRWR
jgi:hypothetical protein